MVDRMMEEAGPVGVDMENVTSDITGLVQVSDTDRNINLFRSELWRISFITLRPLSISVFSSNLSDRINGMQLTRVHPDVTPCGDDYLKVLLLEG